MNTIGRRHWPEWIIVRLAGRKNVEVKKNEGNYYLYEYVHEWNKRKKISIKTSKYVGVLKQSSNKRVVEHGHVGLVYSIVEKSILPKLKEQFPEDWMQLIAFALNRVIEPHPLKRMGAWIEKTSIEKIVGAQPASAKSFSAMLARIGENESGQLAFMRSLIEKDEALLFDGSIIFSDSKYNRLLEVGHDKRGLFLPKANIALLFSHTRKLPLFFRLYFGSIHDVRTLSSTISEVKNRNAIFIADKGYYKNDGFQELHANHIKFIIPLPRDDGRINYETKFNDFFEFHKRIVHCARYAFKKFFVYRYEDEFLKFEERTEYFRLKNKGHSVKFNEGWAGSISLLSNIKMDPKKVYLMWKTRDQIEKAFHVFQNTLETDTPYVSGEGVFRGYIFGSYLALYLYYRLLNLLQAKGVNDSVSVKDLVYELSKVMVYEDTGTPLEYPKKVGELIKTLDIQDMVTKNWKS
jgi:transposase